MTARDLHTLLAHAAGADARSDADLVAAAADPAALTALVRRHGPLVWTTCRRMLPHPVDAADAFQAVFLALAKSATRIRTPAAVGGWLHAAAVRVCLKQRRTAARRRSRERRAARPEAGVPVADAAWDAILAAVHEEIELLPDGERTAFVVCELQGVPAGEAARRLGWKPGTLTGRLSKARARLLTRLSARGFGPAAGLAGVSAVAVPAEVLALAEPTASVSPAVAALSAEVTAMATTKHLAAAVLVTAGLLAGVGGVAVRADGDPPPGLKLRVPALGPTPVALDFAVPLQPPADALVTVQETNAIRFEPTRPGWEHHLIPKPDDADQFVRVLEERGRGGWEYAGVISLKPPAASGQRQVSNAEYVVFKRPVIQPAVTTAVPPPTRPIPSAMGGAFLTGGPPDPEEIWGFVSKGQPSINLNDPANARVKEWMNRPGQPVFADSILTKEAFIACIQQRNVLQPAVQVEVYKLRNAAVAEVVQAILANRDLSSKLTSLTPEPVSNTITLAAPPDVFKAAHDLIVRLDAKPLPPATPPASVRPPQPAPPPSAALVGVLADALVEQPLVAFDDVYAQVKKANPNLPATDPVGLKWAVAYRLSEDVQAVIDVWEAIGGAEVRNGANIRNMRLTLSETKDPKAVAAAVERWGLIQSPGGQISYKQFEELWRVRPLGLERALPVAAGGIVPGR